MKGNSVGYIYAIEAGPFVKIGHSWVPQDRVKQIGGSVPYPCRLLGFFDGDTSEERDWHNRLAEWRAHGEWFHRDGEGVVAFIESITKGFPRKARGRASAGR